MGNEEIRKGYEKIAFGSICDPVRLIFCEDAPPGALDKMDLFAVSEIKKLKGGMEIKFFDRLKAMQCLELMESEEKHTGGFYEALEAGAQMLAMNRDAP